MRSGYLYRYLDRQGGYQVVLMQQEPGMQRLGQYQDLRSQAAVWLYGLYQLAELGCFLLFQHGPGEALVVLQGAANEDRVGEVLFVASSGVPPWVLSKCSQEPSQFGEYKFFLHFCLHVFIMNIYIQGSDHIKAT